MDLATRHRMQTPYCIGALNLTTCIRSIDATPYTPERLDEMMQRLQDQQQPFTSIHYVTLSLRHSTPDN
eukprot:6363314-Amphidinium_carterae.1